MFAGIYRDFAGKSECRDFKFTGIACIPAIPVIFEVTTLCGLLIYTLNKDLFSNFLMIFAGISGIHVIPVIIICTLQGMFCNTGIPCTFYGGKICSAPIGNHQLFTLSCHHLAYQNYQQSRQKFGTFLENKVF